MALTVAGAMLLGAGIGGAASYLSAKEQSKAAKEASKPQYQEQTRVPYMNEYISKIAPYILSEQQRVYESRMKGYGLEPGDFSPIASLLGGIPMTYSGLGKPGAPQFNTSFGSQAARPEFNPYNEQYGTGMAAPDYNREGIAEARAERLREYAAQHPDEDILNFDRLIDYWGGDGGGSGNSGSGVRGFGGGRAM